MLEWNMQLNGKCNMGSSLSHFLQQLQCMSKACCCVQDLFSEMVAPQPKVQQQMPGAQPYGQLGTPLGQAGLPVHPGFAPGMMAYPLQPSAVPPGYLSLDQHYFLSSPGVGAAPPVQLMADAPGPGSSPAAAVSQPAPPPENDVFSSLVPGLRSTLPTALLPPPTAAAPTASFTGGASPYLPQYNAAQQPLQFQPYGAMGMQQYGQPAAAQSNGGFEGAHSSGDPFFQGTAQPGSFAGGLPGHAAFGAPSEARPKRAGGNPFA